ncbi:MAG: Gfo/Idh/MocA family oxidoreductase [Pirellulaceae bacterium]|nr:Gfo/Idh/MocA family oxidoreductase [Pirellulaceae bacterium]
MSHSADSKSTRREFLKNTGQAAAASTLAAAVVPHVHAAEDNTIRVALVGCGGRGTGAAANALSVENGPIKLVAMADVFADRLTSSFANLHKAYADRMDVPEDRRFVGFDGYRQAMDCLQPGDVAIFATPPAFRWVHFGYALEKHLNVFLEKPVTVDGPTTRRMLELADKSEAAGQKVGVGLMWRHCLARQELVRRVKDGQIGDVVSMRCYRLHGPIGSFDAPPKPPGITEVLYQIQRFHSFLWASGGCYSDFNIHNIDELCWLKGDWPVEAHALGGRHYRAGSVDQNFDNYSVEYVFPDGTNLFMFGRCINGCENRFSGYVRGSKGLGTIESMRGGAGTCALYSGQKESEEQLLWRSPAVPNPYQLEWDELIGAIRRNEPYNETRRGAIASLVTSMGRMAAHTGQVVTYEQMLACDHEFAPDVDKLTPDSPPPLKPNADGVYPIPMPGLVKNREY